MPAATPRLADWPLPRVGLGTGTWKFADAAASIRAAELVQFVLSCPNPFFDTAPMYGSGQSETWLGAALRGVDRSRYLLASKAGYANAPGQPPTTDLSRDGLLRSVEGSLQRLGTDYLDVLHLHDPDGRLREALDVALPTLCRLREEGVVRAVGAGMNQWQMLAEFAHHADVDCFLLAGRYTLLEQTALSLLDLCRERGIALFLGGVFNSGILATGVVPGALYNYAPAPPEILERVRGLAAVCARHAVRLPAAAVQFAQAHPAVRTLIVGANTVDEFTAALAALATPLPAALWDDLAQAGLIAPGAAAFCPHAPAAAG